MSSNYAERDGTSSALLEQLVYIDNFMSSTTTGTPNLDVDGQLSLDLAAFADDSFIFPDADKPRRGNDDNDNDANDDHFDHFEVDNHNGSSNGNAGKNADTADNHFHPHELSNLINKASPVEHSPIQTQDNSNIDHHHHLNRHQRGLHPHESAESVNGTHDAGSSLNILELPKVPVPPGAQSSLVAAGLSQNQIDLLAALVAQHQLSGTKLYHASPAPPLAATSNSGYRQSTVHQHNLLSNFSERSNIVGTDHFRDNTPSSSSPATSSTSSTIQVKQEDSQGNVAAAHHNFSGFGNPMSLHQRSASYDGYNDSNSEAGGVSELDKRRRNTAASARFRIKKKQKEKEMVSTILQLSDATRNLEMKILQLEMENKLLRNLVVERGSKRSEDELKQLKERAQLSGRNNLKLDQF